MASKSLFKSVLGALMPRAETVNHEGAPAYELSPRQALAQYAATGTLNATFYADDRAQLDAVLALARAVEPEFLARVAVHAFEHGRMKDVPALLLAVLSTLEGPAFAQAFRRVAVNGRMLRNFVQIMRSGAVGRKSLGTRPKRMVLEWLEAASDEAILRASVGRDPSLADIVRMVHPKPASREREALYAWLIGRPYDVSVLPEVVRAFEAFKRDPSQPVPAVPFQMLTSLPLTADHWAEIARHAGWQMLRQNLNTFARHGVFEVPGFADRLAARLADPEEVRRARVFPYQLMVAHAQAGPTVPGRVREALQDAMEVALGNVPVVSGNVVVCPDVSGSMGSPVTGYRRGSTSVVRCIDVAALFAAAMLRRNPLAEVLPFEERVVPVALNPRDSVMTNAAKLAAVGGGGTNCSAPLAQLNATKARVDLVVFVSDNQSWVDATRAAHGGTAMMAEWRTLKARNPKARLVCIDIQPYAQVQVKPEADILHVGGFSDAVFDVVASFMETGGDPDHFVRRIEAVAL